MKQNNALHTYCLSLLAGLVLPFAFAPFHFYFIAFISPTLLLYCWLSASPQRAFWQGLLFGMGFFGIGVSWVYISIHHYGNANVILSAFITAAFAFTLALFIAIAGSLFSRLFHRAYLPIKCLCAFPAIWVISEWCRAWVGTGFPWVFLGYSQTPSWISGYAPLFGVYGMSLIVSILCGAILLLMTDRRRHIKFLSISLILIFSLTGAYLTRQSWTTPASKPLRVSLIQGNVRQELKWDPRQLQGILQHYSAETEKHWSSELIVWPEAAIPAYPGQIQPFMDLMDREAKKHDSTLIVGAPLYHPVQDQAFNGLLALGNQQGVYLKRHLVPFGEYIPLQFIFAPAMKYFNIPMSGFTSGPPHQATLIAAGVPIAPFICYEIAYPFEVLSALKNAQLILVISDDSWFGQSVASPQQLQMAQLRARETGRPMLYSTNTGITAMIDAAGQIKQKLPVDQPDVLTTEVTPMTGTTPLMRWRFYPTVSLILLFLGLGLYCRKK